jgi:vitamin B12 transporter
MTLSTGLSFADGVGFSGRVNFTYTGPQQVGEYESSYPYNYTVVELDSFVVTDLSLSYRFLRSEKYGDYTIRGELRNLFDEDYAYVKGYPMPGRSVWAGLKWEW